MITLLLFFLNSIQELNGCVGPGGKNEDVRREQQQQQQGRKIFSLGGEEEEEEDESEIQFRNSLVAKLEMAKKGNFCAYL